MSSNDEVSGGLVPITIDFVGVAAEFIDDIIDGVAEATDDNVGEIRRDGSFELRGEFIEGATEEDVDDNCCGCFFKDGMPAETDWRETV
jgi:hypothetical protein